jgi:hypothetical protein
LVLQQKIKKVEPEFDVIVYTLPLRMNLGRLFYLLAYSIRNSMSHQTLILCNCKLIAPFYLLLGIS